MLNQHFQSFLNEIKRIIRICFCVIIYNFQYSSYTDRQEGLALTDIDKHEIYGIKIENKIDVIDRKPGRIMFLVKAS